MDGAAAAFHLVLRTKRKCRCGCLLWRHTGIVRAVAEDRKT
jgi:hypothetical protein